MNLLLIAWVTGALGGFSGSPAPVEQRVLVPAPLEKVWEAWTTEAGLTGFFAPEVNLDLRVGGAYEILFFPDRPEGQRGAEGTSIMALEPPRRLAFSWDAPPRWPEQRAQRTMVDVRLIPEGDATRVVLRQIGFGAGPQWQEVRDYFEGGWAVVLKRLQRRFESGPIDWQQEF